MQTGDGLLVRLNPVAGGLPPGTLIGLCSSAARHGNGIMEVTQRGSIQIRGLTPQGALDLADDVNALGIAVRTGVPVEMSPLAGLDPDEIADPRPLAEAIRTAVESAGLPRLLGPKVSVVVDGGGRIGMDGLLADVRLAAMRQDDGTLWHLAVGGTAATARPVGLFGEEEACAAALAVLEAIAKLGQEGRGRDLDTGQFKDSRSFAPPTVIPDISPTRGEIGGFSVASPPPPPEMSGSTEGGAKEQEASRLATRRPDLSGLSTFPLTDATLALGVALPFGSMPAEQIAGLALEAEKLGATEIRPAPDRMLLVLGLAAESAAALQAKATALGFVTDADDPRLFIAACPGAPACASGHIETRALAEQVALQNAGLLDGSFTLHISGCAKGCAHPGPAALTLVGGENGAGLVVNGTAKTLPAGYASRYDAARGLGRLAALVRAARRPDETAAACLARLGAGKIETAFARNRHVRG
jgi:precorrin-3B synthase